MERRPLSLTIIGWFLVIASASQLISSLVLHAYPGEAAMALARSPLPVWGHQLINIVGSIVGFACAYGVFKGLNWSRYFYLSWGVFGILFGLVTVPINSMLLFNLVFLLIVGFFLFHRPANEWFTHHVVSGSVVRRQGTPAAAGRHVMRRAVSILLFVFGGWMLVVDLAVAFLDVPDDGSDGYGNVHMAAASALIATVPLFLGAWASPGQRWRELGLTILLAAGIALLCIVTMAALFIDPAFRHYTGATPEFDIAPLFGVLNLLVTALVGWLLYRRGVRS